MNKLKFIEIEEACRAILKAISSSKTQSYIESESDDFKRGAYWGMSWASLHLCQATPQYTLGKKGKEKWYYPCNYCGNCPIWLAAYETPELQTLEDIIKECEKRNCELLGKEVPPDVLA